MVGGRNYHRMHAVKWVFLGREKFGNDAGDGAAVIENGFGDRAHQADRSAAIDQPDVVLGEDLAEGDRSFDKAGIGSGAGAAIDADGFDLVHLIYVALQRKKLKSGDAGAAAESARKCARNGKVLSFKAVRSIQTLYMTGICEPLKIIRLRTGAPSCCGH